ncbi:response regulator [Rhabdaerophilum sp. SD176]|uniref:response regulator transcription factor n=1 Tax=Rhabdaerophilum sp. SD176 TaxID=2983548 RepID=UPI0024DF5AE1|nr:response regulator [Rhabdaerophilum sp. SD176]
MERARLALLDDDPAVLDSLSMFFAQGGMETLCFVDAETFLYRFDKGLQLDCIVTDVRMPGQSGLDVVRHVTAHPAAPPVIVITGHGDVAMAVSALKQGAHDFLEKPFNEAGLLALIHDAIAATRDRRAAELARLAMREQFEALPPRQRQVLVLAAEGYSTKEIALKINISPRTVEGHRAWGMQKLKARNLADVVRIVQGYAFS